MKFETFLFDKIDQHEVIQVPVPQCYMDCVKLIQSDYYRVYDAKASLFKIWLVSFRNHCIKYLFWMRMSSYHGWLYLVCKWRQEHFGKKYGLEIPPSTKIGYGFYIGHGISIVVNRTAIIGNNVNISQCCTIGSNYGHAAWIGNSVYIGPNTCVIEDVRIGCNTIIGAGSIVTKSIDENSIAVGSPCKVISSNNHPEFIKNRWVESFN